MKTLGDYELGERLFASELFSEFLATDLQSGASVRLIQFGDQLSSEAGFRAEFRKDLPLLCSLKHFHILPVLDSGESNGCLFYTTECPEGDRLTANSLGPLTWDQLADLAWQLTSAVQHAHNLGLSHGRLSGDCVFVSRQLRVQVDGFGIQQWIDTAKGYTTDEVFRHEADNRQVVAIFQELLSLTADSDIKELNPLKDVIDTVQADPGRLTVRDIQRRLGGMLLTDNNDAIDLIDDRAGQSLNRRSLVDELFDDLPTSSPPELASRKSNTTSIVVEILCIVTLLLLLVLGIWTAMR